MTAYRPVLMLMRAATVVQVLQDLFYVSLQLLVVAVIIVNFKFYCKFYCMFYFTCVIAPQTTYRAWSVRYDTRERSCRSRSTPIALDSAAIERRRTRTRDHTRGQLAAGCHGLAVFAGWRRRILPSGLGRDPTAPVSAPRLLVVARHPSSYFRRPGFPSPATAARLWTV